MASSYWDELYSRLAEPVESYHGLEGDPELQRGVQPRGVANLATTLGFDPLFQAPIEAGLKQSGIAEGGMDVTPGMEGIDMDPTHIDEETWIRQSAMLGGMLAVPAVAKGYQATARGAEATNAALGEAGTVRFAPSAGPWAKRAFKSLRPEERAAMKADPREFVFAGEMENAQTATRGRYGGATYAEQQALKKSGVIPEETMRADVKMMRAREKPHPQDISKTSREEANPWASGFHEAKHPATMDITGRYGHLNRHVKANIDEVFKLDPAWHKRLKTSIEDRVRRGIPGVTPDDVYTEAASVLHERGGTKAWSAASGEAEPRIAAETAPYGVPSTKAVDAWSKLNRIENKRWGQQMKQRAAGRRGGTADPFEEPAGRVTKPTLSEADVAKLKARTATEKGARGQRPKSRDEATEFIRKAEGATKEERTKYIDRSGVQRREPYKGKRRPTSEERGTTALDEILKKEDPNVPPQDIDAELFADYPELFEGQTPKGIKEPLPPIEEAPITPVKRRDIWSKRREPMEQPPTKSTVREDVAAKIPTGDPGKPTKTPLRKKYDVEGLRKEGGRSVSDEAIRGYRMRGRKMAAKLGKDPKAVVTRLVQERLKAKFTPQEIEAYVARALKGM